MADPQLVNGHVRSETVDTVASDTATLTSPSPQASTFVKPPLPGEPANAPVPSAASPIIPPEHPFRTLVLCFDGTGDQFDSDNSNIVELFTHLKKDDRSKQMVYYQAGIGTYTTPQVATPIMAKMSKTLDEAVAWNLDAHVMEGYEFLMQNFTAGDRICIFGFSRGAYTARALAGMIHKVGLLPACNHQQVPFAYKMFTTTDEIGWKQSNAFKKAFSTDVDIEFIGVWDTVNSVGIIPKRLPFTTSNTIVRTFRHAVALDERRAKFKANLWNRPNAKEEKLGISSHTSKKHAKKPECKEHTLRAFERKFAKDHSKPTDIEEVWFSGCHCDVGGGSVSNETTNNLARIPLRWMIRECFRTNSGIMFDAEGLKSLGLDPKALYPQVLPRPPPLPVPSTARIRNIPKPVSSTQADKERALHNYANADAQTEVVPHKTEEELELADALSPIYDQLSLAWFWWFLELFPLKQRYQRSDNTWASYLGWNMGRGRFIPKQKSNGVRVHRSVKMRMEALHENGQKYEPKAAFDLARTTWVD